MATLQELEESIRRLEDQVKELEISDTANSAVIKESSAAIATLQGTVADLDNKFRLLEVQLNSLDSEFQKFKNDTLRTMDNMQGEIVNLNVTMQSQVLPEVEQLQQLDTSLGTPGDSANSFNGDDPYNAFGALAGIVSNS